MSFWIRGKSRQGKRYYYSVTIPWMLIWTVCISIVLFLLLPLMGWLRQVFGH